MPKDYVYDDNFVPTVPKKSDDMLFHTPPEQLGDVTREKHSIDSNPKGTTPFAKSPDPVEEHNIDSNPKALSPSIPPMEVMEDEYDENPPPVPTFRSLFPDVTQEEYDDMFPPLPHDMPPHLTDTDEVPRCNPKALSPSIPEDYVIDGSSVPMVYYLGNPIRQKRVSRNSKVDDMLSYSPPKQSGDVTREKHSIDSNPKVTTPFEKLPDPVEEHNIDSNPKDLSSTMTLMEILDEPWDKDFVPNVYYLPELSEDMFFHTPPEQFGDVESLDEDPNTHSDPEVENEKDVAKLKDSADDECWVDALQHSWATINIDNSFQPSP